MEKSTAEKALSLNLIRPLYGSIAEIGAGQEVARWFFKVGGAAGTIAKAMSAYDMKFSDDIYGREKSGRYVVESRVRKMLEHEYSLLETRLSDEENRNKYFFSFADTVAAKSFKYTGDCHGWMGVRFQQSPTDRPSQVIIHVRMLDKTNLHQQEALGILGVNLIYACYNLHDQPEEFLKSLLHGELKNRVEINVIRFEGPLFDETKEVENNLLLFKNKLSRTVLIPNKKQVSHLAEEFYEKQVIIHRGSFDPPLKTDIDILKCARDHYCGQKVEGLCDPYMVSEVRYDREINDFAGLIKKVEQLQNCDQNILVTDFDRTYKLTEYVAKFTNNHINVVFRTTKIIEILENERLASLDRLARIFNERTRIYIYPVDSSKVDKTLQSDPSKPLFTLSNYKPTDLNINLYKHLIGSEYIQELTNYDEDLAKWDSDSAALMKKTDATKWKNLLACQTPES